MNINSIRTCSYSECIVIAVVSSAKDIILRRNNQIVVCFYVSHWRRHAICAEVHRVAHSDHFVLDVDFYRIGTFTDFCKDRLDIFRFMVMLICIR